MIFIFISEVFECCKNRVRSCLTKTAHCAVLDLSCQLFEQLDIAVFSFALSDPLKDLKHSLCTYTAVVTLTAGLFLCKVKEES